MGSNESRDMTSIFTLFFGIIWLLINFVFVAISKILNVCYCCWVFALTHTKGLQSELESANKEGECVRQRLRYQNDQLERVKEKHDIDASDEHRKYGKLYLCII